MNGELTDHRPLPPVWVLFGVAALLVACTGIVSHLELVGQLAGPVALVLLYRIEPLRSLLAVLAGFLLLAAVTRDPVLAAQSAVPVGLSGLILARGMALGLRPAVAIAQAAIPFLLLAFLLIASPISGEERAGAVDEMVRGSMAINQEMGRDAQTLEMMEAMTRQMVELALVITPAALLLYFLGITTIVYRLSGGVLERYGFKFRKIPPFAEWKAPFFLVWVFVGGLAGVLVGGGIVRSLAANLLFAMSVVYFVQGLSILTWQFRKRGYSLLVRTVFYLTAVLLVFPFFMVAATATGLFDAWFDFRRFERDKESEE